MKKSVLVIAAHPDDEVLGCGGTIARLVSEGIQVNVIIAAQGITSRRDIAEGQMHRELELLRNQSREAHKKLGVTSAFFLDFPDNKLDAIPLLDLVWEIERIINIANPGSIYTHQSSDVNVDHQRLHEAVLAATRPQPGNSILETFYFEIPSNTEWRFSGDSLNFSPNYFVDITKFIDNKIDALKSYESEMRPHPHPRSYVSVERLSEWRGSIVGVLNAEAFEVGRIIRN